MCAVCSLPSSDRILLRTVLLTSLDLGVTSRMHACVRASPMVPRLFYEYRLSFCVFVAALLVGPEVVSHAWGLRA